MNLVKISDNILVNPKCISCIEQKIVHEKRLIIVWVEGRSYTLGVPIEDFMQELDNLEITSNGQYFSG